MVEESSGGDPILNKEELDSLLSEVTKPLTFLSLIWLQMRKQAII